MKKPKKKSEEDVKWGAGIVPKSRDRENWASYLCITTKENHMSNQKMGVKTKYKGSVTSKNKQNHH